MATQSLSDSRRALRLPAQRLRTFLFLATLILLSGMTVSAKAQDVMSCNAREDMTDALKKEYAEQPVGLGVTNVGTVIELWQGREGSSWTLLLTMPNGDSCIVGAGSDWIQVEAERNGAVSWIQASPKTR